MEEAEILPPKRQLPQHAKKTKKRKHTDPAVLALRTLVQESCKINDLATAWQAYEKAIEEGTSVETTVFYCLMSLCDGLGERGIHVGTPSAAVSAKNHRKERCPASLVPDSKRQEYAETILSHMQEVKLPLTEAVYTALVRLNARAGSVDRAIALLTEAEGTQQCHLKLRLYTPVLVAFATNGDILNAVRIWKRLVDQGLRLTEKELRVLLEHSKCLALTQRLLSELAEEIPVLSRATISTMENLFQQDFEEYFSSEDSATLVGILADIHPIPPVSVLDLATEKQKQWLVSPVCQIDTENGKLLSGCLEGRILQPVAVPESSFLEMTKMNDEAARTGRCNNQSAYQGGGKGRRKPVSAEEQEKRAQQWQSFLNFLDSAGPIDVVIDGANVGYSFQNFAGAPKHVSYEKIDAVVSRFTMEKKRVLVFLHCRHFMQPLMPKYAESYLEKWNGILYQTPAGMNDDWFFFHAALLKSSLMVSNDEMRDHYFQMVSPKALTRWRERHQVRFTLRDERDLKLHYPNPYSRRIQAVGSGLVVPLPKRGDMNRFLDGAFVAGEEEPEEETYLCVCPKPQEKA